MPLNLWSVDDGIFFMSVQPVKTISAEVMVSEEVESSQAAEGMAVLLNPTTANCVLSPNSATVI